MLKIGLILLLFIVLLAMRLPLYITLFAAAFLTGFQYLIMPEDFLRIFVSTLSDRDVWELFIAIYLILFLAKLIEVYKVFPPVFNFLHQRLRDKRLIIPIFPSILGLLPMLGGAVFSAPFVEEAGRNLTLEPEHKTFANYWFRHVWEFFFPLYSGVVMMVKILGVPLWMIVKSQWYMTPIALVYGVGYLFHFIKKQPPPDSDLGSEQAISGKQVLTAFFPFIVIVIGVFLKLDFVVLIALATIPYAIWLTVKMKGSFWRVLYDSLEIKMAALIVTVFFFKKTIELSGMAMEFKVYSQNAGFSVELLLILLPFMIGLLTGVSNAFVGIGFPLLLPLLRQNGDVDFSRVLLAYVSGYGGVLCSPVHLCLILSNEYFGSRLHKVYPPVILGVAILIGVALCRVLF
ncbi:MAG: DUF401 family protein [Candidatus Wallbacteria bacterium]|nr:DUF401 family protein [Candidatus Wallbacteria bacterium]